MPNSINLLSTTGAKETRVSTSSRNTIMGHLSNFLHDNNLEAVVSDYTDESILITQNATYTGPEEIRAFFRRPDHAFSKTTVKL